MTFRFLIINRDSGRAMRFLVGQGPRTLYLRGRNASIVMRAQSLEKPQDATLGSETCNVLSRLQLTSWRKWEKDLTKLARRWTEMTSEQGRSGKGVITCWSSFNSARSRGPIWKDTMLGQLSVYLECPGTQG